MSKKRRSKKDRKRNAKQAELPDPVEFQGGGRVTKIFDHMMLSSAKASKQMIDDAKKAKDAYENMEGPFNTLSRGQEHLKTVGQKVVEIWQNQAKGLEKYTDAAMKLSNVQGRLYALNLSPEENQRALQGINDTVAGIRGLRLDEVTENFLGLHAALGDVGEALEFLGTASKYRFNVKTIFGDQFTDEQIGEQIIDSLKFLEQSGMVTPHGPVGKDGKRELNEEDRARMRTYLNAMFQITEGSQGKITGSTFKNLLGRSGMSLLGISPEGLKVMGWLMEASGAEGAGASILALYNQFSGGSMKASALSGWAGLVGKENIDQSKIQPDKAHPDGPAQVASGWFKQAGLMQTDPIAFINFMEERLKTVYGLDKEKMGPEAYQQAVADKIFGITQEKDSGRALAGLITHKEEIIRDADNYSRAQDIDAKHDDQLKRIQGQIAEYKAAVDNFHTVTGTLFVGLEGAALKDIVPILKAVSDFLMQHPEAAKMAGWLVLGGKALSGIAETNAALRLGGLIKDVGALGEAAGGAEKNVGSLGSKMGGLPKTAAVSLLIAFDAWAVDKIIEFVKAYMEIRKAQAEQESSAATRAKAIHNDKERLGGQISPEEAAQDAEGAIISLNQNKDLEFALDTDKFSWFEQRWRHFTNAPYANRFFNDFDPSGRAVERLRARAPELAEPEILRAFIDKIESGAMGLSEEAKNKLLKGLKNAFPEAWYEVVGKSADALKRAKTNGGEFIIVVDQMADMLHHQMEEMLKDQPDNGGDNGNGGQGGGGPVTLPGHARGGYFSRATPIVIGEAGNEFALPEGKLRGLMASSGSGQDFQVQVHNHIAGDVSAETIARIEQVTRRAVLDSKRELLAAFDDMQKDIRLGV